MVYCVRVEDPSPAEQASEYLRYMTGIRIPDYRRPIVESVLKRLGGGVAAVQRLASDPTALQELVHEVTVPETYLFRHPGHFQALAKLARDRAAAGRGCRVLSAGCATGEEAWSAAAVLANAYFPVCRGFSVEGWELDSVRARQAGRGEFREWSARCGLAGYERFFRGRTGGFRAANRLRPYVSFREVNLAESLPGLETFDAIFFRNVAIYWDDETTQRVVEDLLERLVSDGLFLMGPSDPVVLHPRRWQAQTTAGALVYRRSGRDETTRKAPGRVLPFRLPETKLRARRVETASDTARPPLVRFPCERREPGLFPLESSDDVWLGRASARAAAGRYHAALKMIQSQRGTVPAGARLLEGILLLNLGSKDQALRLLRQAVSMAPEEPAYRRWLAVGLESLGRTLEAECELRLARELEDP